MRCCSRGGGGVQEYAVPLYPPVDSDGGRLSGSVPHDTPISSVKCSSTVKLCVKTPHGSQQLDFHGFPSIFMLCCMPIRLFTARIRVLTYFNEDVTTCAIHRISLETFCPNHSRWIIQRIVEWHRWEERWRYQDLRGPREWIHPHQVEGNVTGHGTYRYISNQEKNRNYQVWSHQNHHSQARLRSI